jgi:putative transposase
VPQSLASVQMHVVFSTKQREPLIDPAIAPRLYEYLAGTARERGCRLLTTGGMPDHVHLLVSFGRELAIADFVRTVKAGSSRWVHDTYPDRPGFAWQAVYGVFSVSWSQVPVVTRYIERQEEHHRTKSFQEEYRQFLAAHEMTWDERYVWD